MSFKSPLRMLPQFRASREAVMGLVSEVADWWDPGEEGLSVVAAYRAKVVANYADSLINLANPGTYDLTEGNGVVTWSAAAGWQFALADSKYFDTGVIPASGWTFLIQFAACPALGTSQCVIGQRDAGDTRFNIYSRNAADTDVVYGAGSFLNVAPAVTAGNLAIAGQQGYRDGAADGGAIGAWVGPTTRDIYIGCWNNQGVAGAFATANIYAVAIYDATLTGPQVLSVATSMAAL